MRRTWNKQRPLVLLLDDDKVTRTMLHAKIKAFADVVESDGEEEATRILSEQEIDLAVVDLELQCGDGLGFIRSVRARAKSATIPVIVLTGSERQGALEESLNTGATSFLTKPLNWGTFGRHIQQVSEIAFRAGYMALHDHLTGLPNRVQLAERMNALLTSGDADAFVTTFAIDLDRFKPINDAFGHFVGDQVLMEVANRLREFSRTLDVVARVGGDEFVLVSSQWRTREDAAKAAATLLDDLRRPILVSGHFLSIGGSVGIDHRHIDEMVVPEQLLKDADLALGEAKRAGRNAYRFFEEQLSIAALVRTAMEISIKQAIEGSQFRLHYQPIMDLQAGTISAFEALIRWQHPTLGYIAPERFISIAEESGQICGVGGWALNEACAAAARFHGKFRVSVNVSPQQVHKRVLLQQVEQALGKSGLSPDCLELEIVESALLDETDATLSILHSLRERGVRIALDDFGSGYSSLGYLRRFPFDKIKIDRSFISEALASAGARSIISAVSVVARAYNISSTAEGVETAAHLELVQAECINEAQGYYFSRPMPEPEAHALLRRSIAGDMSMARAARLS